MFLGTAMFCLTLTASGAAQQSRAEVIEAEQAQKAARLHPYEPSAAERWVERAEAALAGPPTGLYPWFGSIYSGGLFSIGPGLRLPFGGGGAFDTQAAVSLKNYKLARATLTLPPAADRRLRSSVYAQIIDAPSVAFNGVGNDTVSADRTTFHFRPRTIGGSVSYSPFRYVDVGGRLEHLAATTRRAGSGTPAEDRFIEESAPGLGASPRYIVGHLHAAFDWRESPGYSRSGGLYRVDWSNHSERGGNAYSFERVDADLRQLIPLLRANWVVALRAAASTTTTRDGQQVPYFLMPQLGGGSDLRGYSSWRFRDRHRVLFSAEYRWTPSHFVDMAIFHDAGKVAASRDDLGFGNLKHSNGIGIRFHAPNATLLRFELARGSDGLALIVAFGQNF